MLPPARLEALERALDDLQHAAETATLLVEGPKDVAALRDLGIEGTIEVTNQGLSMVALADTLARRHGTIVLLTDWDRTGGRLHRTLKELLRARGVTLDTQHRRVIAGLVGKETKTVEGLPAALRNLRNDVGAR